MSETAARDQGPLALVSSNDLPEPERGQAIVVGHFPPIVSKAASHASALVYLFRKAGYDTATATDPGLSVARHQLGFMSAARYNASAAKLDVEGERSHAAVYAKALDFRKVARPKWHKRRFEEWRRMRCLARIIRTSKRTTLVLDGTVLTAFASRTNWALLATGILVALVALKRFGIAFQSTPAEHIFQRLTGIVALQPQPHLAEDAAYETAFTGASAKTAIRVTAARAEQAARYNQRRGPFGADAILADVSLLARSIQHHDFRKLSPARLIGCGIVPTERAAAAMSSPALDAANQDDEINGFPVTRYMKHLWISHKLARRFPVQDSAGGKAYVDWYLSEASRIVPARWVPVPGTLRDRLREAARDTFVLDKGTEQVVHTEARDDNPFPLGVELVRHRMAREADEFDLAQPVDRVAYGFRTLLTLPEDADAEEVLGRPAIRHLKGPVGGVAGNVSRLEFLLALLVRLELPAMEEIERPWKSAAIRNWAATVVAERLPHLRALIGTAGAGTEAVEAIVGLPNSGTGVGMNLHMSRAAFRHMGLDPAIYDVETKLQKTDEGSPGSRPLARPFALYHVNADRMPEAILTPHHARCPEMVHIGFPLWELDKLPDSHRLALNMLDEIWVPTRFVQAAYEQATDTPVHNVKKGLEVPDASALDLSRFGVPDGVTTFLTCFDFHSSLARKNPLAAVEAFLAAFPPSRRDVRLIVKTTPPVDHHWGDPDQQWPRIEALAKKDPRIIIRTDFLPFSDLLGLVRAADCLVTTHRSEGFGLLPAYALSLATPVVTTDYSGTQDFCTQETAMPVACELVPVRANQTLHHVEGAVWADIDVHALAATLAAFADDPMEGRMRAARGRKLIKSEYAPQAQAERYRTRLEAIGVIEPSADPLAITA